MATFLQAFNISKQNAGGYVNDPDDPGGETYRDISRKYNPQWQGWQVIDSMKQQGVVFKTNYTDATLDNLAANFYKQNFWDSVKLDNVNSQPIANQVFDQTLDGIGRTVQMLKLSLNKLGFNLIVNSQVTTSLIDAVNKAPEQALFEKFKEIRQKRFMYAGGILPTTDEYYQFFAKFGPPPKSGPKYVKGWLNRVNKFVFSPTGKALGIGTLIILATALFFLIKKRK